MTWSADDLAALLATVRRPGDFFAAGTAELLSPRLEVDGVGIVALPLLPAQAIALAAAADPAPYGRGTETLVDPSVRHCRQLGPDQVQIGGRHWPRLIEDIVRRAAAGLGVDGPVSAEFYKLLLYEPGGFFVGHRDTEKAPGMFATLVLGLPADAAGGDLVVRHRGREVRLSLRPEDPAEVAFAAFYADCVHEVLPVTEGYRLTLVYNLLRQARGRPPQPPDYTAEQASAAALLRRWCDGKRSAEDNTPEKLVYPLEHAYTPAELGFAALKGADAAVATVLDTAARDAGCELYLALLTVEESGAAEYAETYRRRRRWGEEDEFEAGEVFDRSMTLSDWRRRDGDVPALGEIPVEAGEFVPLNACDALTPDEEHFHEATGNEGASFERTYRRAALVLWPSERIFAVLSQAGLQVTLPYLGNLVERWAAAGRDQQSRLRREAEDLAGHMIARWPSRDRFSRSDDTPGDTARMLDLLTRLGDAGLIARLLTEVTAGGNYRKADNTAILAALRGLPQRQAAALVERIVTGTAVSAFAACADLLARIATAWEQDQSAAALSGAAVRLTEALPGGHTRSAPDEPRRPEARVGPAAVADLVTALMTIKPSLAERAVDLMLASPRLYGADTVLVPAARRMVIHGSLQTGTAAERLRMACVAHLRTRVAEPLEPPADWRRESALPCRCRACADLSRFLADPAQRSWVLKAAEAERSHVEDSIRQAGADLDTATDRRGRPYSLVCAKNQASYERRATQRRQDLEDLAHFAG
ncbi:2OG-Fe(II) oxygenase [Paracraurococcus lichenis]|uniref:2OG-Fe(II) oxygenase n=1 Tax=Paracraurococcus lichenis TaxID=3064888 RepID=A0ABT9EDB3_9PROT|nr:2OG-Fe(II) oxygenase [Paracraurococcus sp. LOR1-02]MDO9714056.1 2OG-Fe(II) oxygenase [Paracraurococcus sp. LOR1-02]